MEKENNGKKAKAEKIGLDEKSAEIDYEGKPKIDSEIPENVRKEMEKTREKLEKFKKSILKKYSFIIALGILPPQAAEKFEDEEGMSEEEKKKKPIHLVILIPEEKFKEIGKIKLELIKQVEDMKPKVWLHIKTPVDIWNYCLDAKYEFTSAVAMSFPLYDKSGFLGALRVAEIHKELVLRKFEKYVVSYVIAGSLVRGTTIKTSDVDVYIIINDTDVKRMPRLELKEKLRAIIYSYVSEAAALAGVPNKLSPQIYILTEFWESVKDAHPVIFTFIRDGIPLYDQGAFMPWKLLLKMGKIKPSPEAIDMFMSMGDKVPEIVKRRLLDIVMGDIYWGVLTPSQALLMLYGLPPPKPIDTAPQMEKIFVEKEKLLEKKYINILKSIVGVYKDYEHEKIKEVKGEQIDRFLKDSEIYMKRLKELREQIEKRAQEKTVEQIYDDVFSLLQGLFGKKSQAAIVEGFESRFIKTGRFPRSYLEILKDIVSARQKFKKGKLASHQVENARKNASVLVNALIEYSQRCELVGLEKCRTGILYKEGNKENRAELFLTDSCNFLVQENIIKKITDKLEEVNREQFEQALAEHKGKTEVRVDSKVFDVLKKELGDFKIIL